MPTNIEDKIEKMSAAGRRRVELRAKELLAEELTRGEQITDDIADKDVFPPCDTSAPASRPCLLVRALNLLRRRSV